MTPPRTFQTRMQGLISFLERITKTDLKYLFSGGLWLALDEVIGGAVGLLLSIAFANFLPKEAYGTYRYFIALFWTLTAFTMTGLPTALARSVARGHEGSFRSSFLFSARWALPLSIIATLASGYYFLQGNLDLGYGLLIIAGLGPLMQGAYLWSAYLSGKKDFKTLALCGALFAVLPALTLFLTMLVTHNPLTLLFAYLAGTVVTGLTLVVFVFARYKPNSAVDTEFKNLGWHFSAMNLLSTIAAQVDKLVVFHYLGAVELAVYALATALPDQIKNVFGGVATLALPKFAERPFAEIKKNFWYRLWSYTGVLTVVALLYIIIAPFAFDILFPAYHEAVFYSQIFALSLIPIGSVLPITLLQARGAKRQLYVLNILSPVFQILALIMGTAFYGLIGAVIARVAGRTSSFIIANVMLEWYSRTSPTDNENREQKPTGP